MRTHICRLALGLVMWLLAAGFFQPSSVLACGGEPPPDCCQAPVAQDVQHSAAADQPCPFAPLSSSQCCTFCPLALSLIAFGHAPFIFNDTTAASAFAVQDPAFLTRFTRPPYPPPRA